jgi:hypothetical protein
MNELTRFFTCTGLAVCMLLAGILLIGCSHQADYDLAFDGTPSELTAHIDHFQKEFQARLVDVRLEINRLDAVLEPDTTNRRDGVARTDSTHSTRPPRVDSTSAHPANQNRRSHSTDAILDSTAAPAESTSAITNPPDGTRVAIDSTGSIAASSDSNNAQPDRSPPVSATQIKALAEERADSINRTVTRQDLQSVNQHVDALQQEVTTLEGMNDSTYLHHRIDLEEGLNEIVTQLEAMHMRTLDDRFEFMDALDAHLKQLDLELRDLQRRIDLADNKVATNYYNQLSSLESRQQEIFNGVRNLELASYEAFLADREVLTEEVIDFGFDVRNTVDEVLRLTSGDWVIRGDA